MKLFHYSYPTPIENITVDEYLLKRVNSGHFSDGILRLWEPSSYFVVLGLSKKETEDIHIKQCQSDRIPILRRCSGGGTILQGPGCFNYAYILPISYTDTLKSLPQTTTFILTKVKLI